jgi:uncharacterized lipoprotein YehR (DUF1307 family)
MNEKYVVIIENCGNGIYDFYKYHMLPKKQYKEEYNSGDWHYYRFEEVIEFDSKEEAEKFIKEQKDIYVLGRLDSEGILFADLYEDCENVFTQPSLYTVLRVGTKEECEKMMNEILKDYEEEF